MKDELIGYDGIGLSELIQKGELTVLELVDLTIQRIEKVNPRLNPKSTASPCLAPHQNLERAGSNRNYRKKAFKEDPRRFLSSRGCLKPSSWAILDKVLLLSFLLTVCLSGSERVVSAYPDGA